MRKGSLLSIVFSLLFTLPAFGQSNLPVKWEELTVVDFVKAIEKAQGTCVLPFGILEKHGPHLPLGSDLMHARYVSIGAAKQEYAVVFPEYYFGQIFEARHQPGTIAYSLPLQLQLLQETTDEMSRNGCKKILIVNGHGGNGSLLPLFAQSQLASPRDYVVYVHREGDVPMPANRPALKSSFDSHGGERETSRMLVARQDAVRLETAGSQSGADQRRLSALPPSVTTGIWWYARFPNHYAGDATPANKELGEFEMKAAVDGLASILRAIKADDVSLKLQKEFYERAKEPLKTQQ